MKKTNQSYLPANPPKIPTRQEFHRQFGGVVTPRDFNSAYPTYPSYLAPRISSAQQFDRSCRRGMEQR